MLNKAHVIEIAKEFTVSLMKARNSLVFDVERERKRKQKMVKMYFL